MKGSSKTWYQKIYPGIYRITLPLPGKKPGPVNTYLFTGRPVTLIDTGTLKTVQILDQAIADLGMDFTDIEQIIITHGHIDHYGAAQAIVQRSRGISRVFAHEEDRPLIEQGIEVPPAQFIKFYRLMGVPKFYQISLILLLTIFKSMAKNCRIDRFLNDGEKIAVGDYEATVITTPGHTRGSICLYLEKEDILFPGDHILGHITPNAFVMLEAASVLPGRMSQVEYNESLGKIGNILPQKTYPAHGSPIDDVNKTIAMFRDQFLQRQRKILSLLQNSESTVYQLGRKLFPDIRGKRLPLEVYLSVSEVYTHLQVLQLEKSVTSRLKKSALYYKCL